MLEEGLQETQTLRVSAVCNSVCGVCVCVFLKHQHLPLQVIEFYGTKCIYPMVFCTSFTAASQIGDGMNYVSADAAPNVLILSGVHTHRFAHKHTQRTAGKPAHPSICWVGPLRLSLNHQINASTSGKQQTVFLRC